VKGITISSANSPSQAAYIVETEAVTSGVDWRNVCPESRAELGDALSMSDHIGSISPNAQRFKVTAQPSPNRCQQQAE
jgi:hypothetical protein